MQKIYKADCRGVQRSSDIYLVVLLLKPCSITECYIYIYISREFPGCVPSVGTTHFAGSHTLFVVQIVGVL